MTKSDEVYLRHILECLNRIQEYTAGSKKTFLADHKTQDAVLRNLQVMAESTQKISGEIKNAHSELPWKKLGGFRNILVHNYLGINIERIWKIVEEEVPSLRSKISKILGD